MFTGHIDFFMVVLNFYFGHETFSLQKMQFYSFSTVPMNFLTEPDFLFFSFSLNVGCKDNKLELRDGDGLAHYYFQGTSYSPESKNKHINKDQPQGATWCPDNSKINDSFLEVDLTGQYLLCGVSTQGNGTAFTKTYKIELSSDRIQWAFYQDNGTDKVMLLQWTMYSISATVT